VIDPVMVASSGDRLLKPDARHALCEKLLPLATVLTPNRNEAALLLGWPVRDLLNAASLCEAGWVLAKKFGVAVLVKGGNLGGVEALDFLCTAKSVRIFRAPWFKGIDPHGTGCTYSAAIAAGLAKGHALETAVGLAKQFITRAIFSHFRLGKYLVLNQLPK
jgi:hydroxymethylpyrimidine/phosphomethylpyrimidine kinase